MPSDNSLTSRDHILIQKTNFEGKHHTKMKSDDQKRYLMDLLTRRKIRPICVDINQNTPFKAQIYSGQFAASWSK